MALRTNLRVLVVDDMSVSRQILTQMLDRLGVRRVETANSGQDALNLLALSPADLVIADLNMPGMDGVDLLRSMRRSDRTHGARRHRRTDRSCMARGSASLHSCPEEAVLLQRLR